MPQLRIRSQYRHTRPRPTTNQRIAGIIGGEVRTLFLPDPRSDVIPGLPWGDATEFFTPAFWAAQAWHFHVGDTPQKRRLGNTLAEEIAACLLGGHGLPAEVGIAAFEHLRDLGLLRSGSTNEASLLAALREPLMLRGRTVHYRFARQKAKYIAVALNALTTTPPPKASGGRHLRSWLVGLPGIGPKTASWIVRNWCDSDEVAILDIHIYRAGRLTGFFSVLDRISRNYVQMEQKFLEFAWGIGVRPSHLDAVIWRRMKEMGRFPISLLDDGTNISASDPSVQAW